MTKPSAREIRFFYQRQGKTADHQENIYEKGDLFRRWWQNKRKYWADSLLRQYVGKYSSLLDAGCAEGLFVRESARQGAYSVGVDISKPKLKRAVGYAVEQSVKRLNDFVLASAEFLPFRPNSFEVNLSLDVIRYLRDPLLAINELLRTSGGYSLLQSETSGRLIDPKKILSSRIFPKKYDFSDPIDGDLWIVTPAFLTRVFTGKTDAVVVAIIGHLQALVGLLAVLFFPFFARIDGGLFIRILDGLDDLLANKPIFNMFGIFTTVLVKRKSD